MPSVKDLLTKLELGNSVAEFDEDLEKYFVETETFRKLVDDRIDIVAGDKGTGKTAIYRILQKRHPQIEQLRDIEILPAFNPSGSPIFQKLADTDPLSESEYISLWKAYLLSLTGNWLLGTFPEARSEVQSQLEQLLVGLGLRDKSHTPLSVFSRILSKIGRLFNWDSIEADFTMTPEGAFSFKPRIGISKDLPAARETPTSVSVEMALRLLNKCLDEVGFTIWIAMDRLDEAFQGSPDVEIPALRALFRTYLDLLEFPRLRLKLFVRRDLFRRITGDSFVNLTHVNARKVEMIWDEEDLLNLLCRRIRQNEDFCNQLGIEDASDTDVFMRLFPKQVDQGTRKPQTWVWMMRRIRDGNDIKPPRNLIDLVSMAQQAQLRREERSSREYDRGLPIMEPDALRRALTQLSDRRVHDTLLAEAKTAAPLISRFRGGKAEHNDTSLSAVLGTNQESIREVVEPLIELGFLEDLSGTYKIPSLYREGLEVTQGKAFEERLGSRGDEEE